MAAKEEALSQLHATVAEVFTRELSRKDEDGNEVAVSPAMLQAAIKFLKDNGIDCEADKNEKLKALAKKGTSLLEHPFPVGEHVPHH